MSMISKKLKVAIVLNIIPSYREGFYDALFENRDIEVTVYAQECIPGLNLKTIHNRYPKNVKLVKFICAKREKIGWQFLPFYQIFKNYDVVVVDGNPRQISHFLLGTFLRLVGKKVILWTMAHSFRGFSPTENLRLFWSRMFKYIFVYTDSEVDFLREKGFKEQYILGMNNGLNQKKIDIAILEWNENKLENWLKTEKLVGSLLLLSSARLDPKNKFEQIIQALPLILEKFPNLIWCIIGKGVEEDKLRELVNTLNIADNVRFVGEIYDENDLAPWFLSSKLFIHPAAVGLSLLHAFGYGLPLITNGNKHLHNPEYSAFEEGLTGLTFAENNIEDLASIVIKLLNDEASRNEMKLYTQKVAREKYNSEVMSKRFLQIIEVATTV
jgi:glycosyltransferase involved in cell wall biosynthesis